MKASRNKSDPHKLEAPEAAYRDFLAEHLDLLEPGLTLVRKEFPLSNPVGAGGFVDVLARDRFGLYVVVEIKRSTSTSREAIQELYKYVELIQKNFGLTHAQVRCVLLSTDWHELLVPFSAFVRTVPFHSEGYCIVSGKARPILRVERVQYTLPPEPLRLFRQHTIFLFRDEGDQQSFVGKLEPALARSGVVSAVVAAMRVRQPSPSYLHPYCQYLMVGGVTEAVNQRIEKELRAEYGIPLSEPVENSTFEGQVACEVMEKCGGWDSVEVGYPEKFVSLLETWGVTKLHRFGRFAEDRLFTDEDLLTAIAGLGDTSQTMFVAQAKTSHTTAWGAAKQRALACLRGNEQWSRITAAYFAEAEAAPASRDASIAIYNPADLVMTLFKIAGRGDPRFVPSMHVGFEADAGGKKALVLGVFAWDGKTCPTDPQGVLADVFGGDPFDYFAARTIGGLADFDQELMQRHGLRYAAAEWVDGAAGKVRGRWLELESEKLSRRGLHSSGCKPLSTFVRQNRGYLQGLVEWLSANSFGA